MLSIENVTEVIDQEIDRLGIESLTLQETIELLYSKGVFDASNPKAEKEFRVLLDL